MEYLITILLGFVQGVTEFLPVSSSGHLVILQSLFNIKEDGLLLDTILHLGTAFAIVVVFRRDILSLVTGSFAKEPATRTPALFSIWFIIIATIPAALLGVLFNDFFEKLFSSPFVAGSMLLVTALLLFISASRKEDSNNPITVSSAVAIGLAQAFAIMPGLSRSGSTIAIALIAGVGRECAGKFSFLIALPVIFGAVALQLLKIDHVEVKVLFLIVGFVVSFITGIGSLQLLMHFVKKGRLYYFGFYCIAIGTVTIIFLR